MKLDNVIAKRPTKTVYRDGDWAVKVFDGQYSAADVLNEAFNLAVVADTGFPVPQLKEVMKTDGRWAIVYRHIEGVSLWELMEGDPENAEKYLSKMADIQLDINDCTAKRLRHHTDKMHMKISACKDIGLEQDARYELHNRLNGMPKHAKLCHGDFTPGNVIITPEGKPFVIDWAHATQGNASADAARTYLRFTLSGHVPYAEMYLDLFCQKTCTEKRYVQKWLSVVAASQLVKNVPQERELLMKWANVVEFQG